VTTEDKFVIMLAVLSVGLLVVGTIISKVLSTAPPKVIRTVWPICALVTAAVYATFVYIARINVKG
jgi:hypothetical protein